MPQKPSPGRRFGRSLSIWLVLALLASILTLLPAIAQENPLGNVQTQAPAPVKTPADTGHTTEGSGPTAPQPVPRVRVQANLVQVPVTVTDPMNRLVTGLERQNFFVYDNGIGQTIKYFYSEDAPLSLGIVFDLSGSMSTKFIRARKALQEFLSTSNPQDEYFVVGFNDRPAVIVDYTSDPDDVEARMVMLRPENRTALIDAIHLAVDHMRQAKYQRKALLILSDGGDNHSRYTEGKLRREVRESDVQIYSIGLFDAFAPTTEEQLGPELLNEICEMTGGRMFNAGSDVSDLQGIASRISSELRNEYVLAYIPSEVKHDGNWRKLKVVLLPPPDLPRLTVQFRQGYYAASE